MFLQSLSNGEPKVYQHVPTRTPAGQVMSDDELHAFAVSVLLEEFGESAFPLERSHPSDPDFILKSGVHRHHVLVVYQRDLDADASALDVSRLMALCEKESCLPRLLVASSWCLSGEAGSDGAAPIAGGEFCWKFRSVSLLANQQNVVHEQLLGHDALVDKFVEMWQTLSVDGVCDYFDANLLYTQSDIFDVFASRLEYLDYIQRKFAGYAKADVEIFAQAGFNADLQETGVYLKLGTISAWYDITTKDGYITQLMLRIKGPNRQLSEDELVELEREQEAAAAVEFEQNMGLRNDCIMNPQVYIDEYMSPRIDEDRVYLAEEQVVKLDNELPALAQVLSLRDGEGDLSFLCLIAYSSAQEAYGLVSIYPQAKGASYPVVICQVLEFDNCVEAVVRCSIGEWTFAFLATDYHAYKDLYVVGSTIRIDLAALAHFAESAGKEFLMHDDDAVRFLEKMGQEPTLDAEGKVEPIRFSTMDLVMFFNEDKSYPDFASFQSPATDYAVVRYCEQDFWSCRIFVHRDEAEVNIPLYIRPELWERFDGKPASLSGGLLMLGQVSEDQ
ncbi:MAG: hypothetical protein R3Y56_08575 [Akkermansia sp.]